MPNYVVYMFEIVKLKLKFKKLVKVLLGYELNL